MLPRERVFRTLEHKEPDLIPWGEHSIDYNIYEEILGRKSYVQGKFRETKALWDGKRDEVVASYKRDITGLADAMGFDIILAPLAPSAKSVYTPMEKIDEETYKDGAGNIFRVSSTTHDLMPYKLDPRSYTAPTVEGIRKEIDGIDREGVPAPDASCWEIIDHVVKERKKTHFIMGFWEDFGWPSFGQTDEDFYVNILLCPEMSGPIAELNGKRAIAGLRHLAERGVDAVMTPSDMGSSSGALASPAIYRKYALQWHKKYAEEAHRLGLKIIKHSCGRVWDFIEDFIEIGYDAYEAIQASAGMDIKILKEKTGGRLTLWGGVTNENLILGKPEDIKKDALYAIRWGAPGGGFIYGASHSLAVGTKRENLLMMKECRERFGTYPIKMSDESDRYKHTQA